MHVARLPVTTISNDAASYRQFGVEPMTAAAQLLRHSHPNAVVWAGTAGSWMGIDTDLALSDALSHASQATATTSTLALLAACEALGAHNVALATPYTDAIVARIRDNYTDYGLTVVTESHLNMSDNWSFARVEDREVRSLVERAATTGVDAVLVVCTNLPATHSVAALEAHTGVPVIDSIAATVWYASGLAGSPLKLTGRGKLLSLDVPPRFTRRYCSPPLWSDDRSISLVPHLSKGVVRE